MIKIGIVGGTGYTGVELLRLLAQGGMADIYLARRLGGIDRYVAVKVLNAQRAGDPEACALFLDEARLLAMLHHTNLGTVFEVDVESGVHYLAMEFVHGVDLREMLAAAARAQQLHAPVPRAGAAQRPCRSIGRSKRGLR